MIHNLDEWVDELNSSAKSIIVEGPNDKKALEQLGIRNSIFILSKKPVFFIAEKVAEKSSQAVLLTDFDKKGKELYKKLKTELQNHGVEIDNKARHWLLKNTRISHIEGILSYAKNNNYEIKKERH